jgi:hypothetical protein
MVLLLQIWRSGTTLAWGTNYKLQRRSIHVKTPRPVRTVSHGNLLALTVFNVCHSGGWLQVTPFMPKKLYFVSR